MKYDFIFQRRVHDHELCVSTLIRHRILYFSYVMQRRITLSFHHSLPLSFGLLLLIFKVIIADKRTVTQIMLVLKDIRI
jgi:hypothetical protein